MKSLNVAAYGQHIMYTDLAKYGEAIRTAGWDSIILAMLHPHPEDDTTHTENIYFGEVKILESGKYKGNPAWPDQLRALVKGTGTTLYHLLASIGGAGVGDFANIKAIYENHNHSFDGTMLQTNFQVFRDTFPAVTIIDMDVEETYDVAFFRRILPHAHQDGVWDYLLPLHAEGAFLDPFPERAKPVSPRCREMVEPAGL